MAGPTVSTTFNAIDKLTGPMRKMQGNVQKMVKVVGAAFIGGSLLAAAGIKSFVTEAAKIEDAAAAFTPLLGGAEKANQLVAALNKTAATTPFQFQDIADVAKQLLPVMNQDIEKTVDTMRMLGDTAGGNAQKLDSITRGFTKAMLKGKVDLESLNMISEAGVPIFDQLAKKMGVSTAAMFKMVTAGKVTTDELTDTFRTMTSEGGLFFGGMEIASQTLNGKLSTLRDNIALAKAAIGTALLPTIKPLLDRFIQAAGAIQKWVEANQALINQKVDSVISGIGTAAKFVADAWNSGLLPAVLAGVATFKAITLAIGTYQSVLATAKAVQIAFNLAMAANPVGLIIVGISALVAGIVLLIQHLDKVKALFDWIGDKANAVGGFIRGITGGGSAQGYDPLNDPTGLISANQGVIESRSVTENRQTVDINIGGLPQGSTVKERGTAPAVRLNTGFGGLRGAN